MYCKKMTSIAAFFGAFILFASSLAFANSKESVCEQYLATATQETVELKNQQSQTKTNDPYIRRANATVVIDNQPTD